MYRYLYDYMYIKIYTFSPPPSENGGAGSERVAPLDIGFGCWGYYFISQYLIFHLIFIDLPFRKKISFCLATQKIAFLWGFFNRQPMGCFDPCAQNALLLTGAWDDRNALRRAGGRRGYPASTGGASGRCAFG